jgi:desulfoferrodoxin-like iron-binding protein
MTKRLQIYKYEICGNMVKMVHAGKGELVLGQNLPFWKDTME